jgi:hypothetical protein
MKIKIVDTDSKIPNLALMKVSAYHKSKGDIVSFDIPDPDKVIASVVFRENAWKARGLQFMYPDAEIEIGGPGWDLSKRLPDEIEFFKPDYDLYPSEYSLGFTTRGCIRKCPFCIVPEKEGKIQRWQHIKEFHDSRFDTVICLDNNIYADRDWFFENTDYVLEHRLKFNAIQGMDIRILTPEIAERLKAIRWSGQYHFAFDNMADEAAVKAGISMLKDAGINTRHDVTFYVLVGFNTTEEEDKFRCRLLKELKTNAFVMQYKRTDWTRKIAWWANCKQTFWSFDIDEQHRRVRA